MLPLFPRIAIAAAALALASGCVPIRQHQGYVIDADLVNSVQPGVDNRASVQQTLGKPTFVGQFAQGSGGGDWYYLARDTTNYAFRTPRASQQITLQISFDRAGTVTAIRRGSKEQIASVDPSNKTTPTLGKKRGFFEDLFGNIGTVGAPGSGGAGSGTGRP
jgi:outer membrane protein assembly factor BamE (lipoprotein component of BamABCDE complex)